MNRCVIDHPIVWLEFIPAHVVLSACETGVSNLVFFALNETCLSYKLKWENYFFKKFLIIRFDCKVFAS